MQIVNAYRKRKTRFRVLTLPKAGTYFLTDLIPNLGIRKARVTHVLDMEDNPMLKPGERAIMTIRDPRTFFASMTNWCDVRAREILDGADAVAEKMDMKPERAADWLTYDYQTKLRYLVTEDDRAIYYTWRIRPHFDCVNAYWDKPEVMIVRFEDMMAWGPDGASDRQIETYQKMAAHFRIRLTADEITRGLAATRGKSKTFVSGGGAKRREEISPENEALIVERWGAYISAWGYA